MSYSVFLQTAFGHLLGQWKEGLEGCLNPSSSPWGAHGSGVVRTKEDLGFVRCVYTHIFNIIPPSSLKY